MATGGYGNPTRHTGYESGAMTTRPLWPQEGMEIQQGCSYRRISRINDMEPPSHRGVNMCNYSPTKRALIPKKGPEGSLMQGPLIKPLI
ncbi:hypothetical protein TNCV_708791 [Trichonephila clavipes]|nr:hypothetical protein TNCV_708791 [Trichonephila clavipes]